MPIGSRVGLAETYAAIADAFDHGGDLAAATPPADGTIRVARSHVDGQAAVVAFAAHILIAADVSPQWVAAALPSGDIAEPMNPPFLSALCARLDRKVNCIDLVTYGPRPDMPPALELREITDSSHPRAQRAHRHRRDVRVFEAEGGILLLGRGLADRWEMAFEVDPAYRGKGLGRSLAHAARALVPSGGGAWAQVSPGNGASVRTLLAAGYEPVGSEVLLVTST